MFAFSAEQGHDEIRRDTASAAMVGVTARGVIRVDVEGECDDCISFLKVSIAHRLGKNWVDW
jgi:hypothetical protein